MNACRLPRPSRAVSRRTRLWMVVAHDHPQPCPTVSEQCAYTVDGADCRETAVLATHQGVEVDFLQSASIVW